MKILVTGGAGMIGSNLSARLVGEGHEVVIVDNMWRGSRSNLVDSNGKEVVPFHSHLIEKDLSIAGALDNHLDGVDFVYHLADIVAGVDFVFRNQGMIFRRNLLINSNVVDSVRQSKVKGYIYVGTACSFPMHLQTGIDAKPLREEDQFPAMPESAYGWSKLMGEYEAFLLEKETGIPVAVLSLHNVYGAPCALGERAQVIPSLIQRALKWPEQPFVVWGSGDQGRSFVHVDDVVDALLASHAKGLGQGLIQIGTNVCTPIRDIARMVVQASGNDIPIHFDKSKPEGDRGRRCDFTKATRILGWQPRTQLANGISNLYRWIESRTPPKF
jgi:GDP-D-mannose 3',5'-epimerase